MTRTKSSTSRATRAEKNKGKVAITLNMKMPPMLGDTPSKGLEGYESVQMKGHLTVEEAKSVFRAATTSGDSHAQAVAEATQALSSDILARSEAIEKETQRALNALFQVMQKKDEITISEFEAVSQLGTMVHSAFRMIVESALKSKSAPTEPVAPANTPANTTN